MGARRPSGLTHDPAVQRHDGDGSAWPRCSGLIASRRRLTSDRSEKPTIAAPRPSPYLSPCVSRGEVGARGVGGANSAASRGIAPTSQLGGVIALITVTGRTQRRSHRPQRVALRASVTNSISHNADPFRLAALCDALQQRRTASALGGLSSLPRRGDPLAAPRQSRRRDAAGKRPPLSRGETRRRKSVAVGPLVFWSPLWLASAVQLTRATCGAWRT